MAFEFPMIAKGHDNADEMVKWKDLNQCLFRSYNNFIPMDWNTQEARELGGDLRYRRIGKSWFRYTFPLLYEEDYNYIFATLLEGEENGPVTVNAYDRDNMVWRTYNALMALPENRNFDKERGVYIDFELDFRELEEVV